MEKIQSIHLNRKAYVYVRQSTKGQVEQNVESRRLQYGLKERAKSLGWRRIEVIDDDLGKSGSGRAKRSGFERLISDVCAGKIGAVLATDASRLARNGREWHTLLEVCGLVDTLIIDQDSVYDSRLPNDRLLLGMKGTLSEMELGILRQRMEQAAREKARRGELYSNLPVGYIRDGNGEVVKDSDLRVQESIELLFKKFRELGSARQVCLWCRQEGIEVPVVPQHSKGYSVVWKLPVFHNIVGILNNPTYAGAYAYGREKRRTVIENGKKRVIAHRSRNPEDWDVLIHERHEGYLSWEDFMTNQRQLSKNNSQNSKMTGGAARKGAALLSGLVRCGHCSQKMYVTYQHGSGGSSYRYCCRGNAKCGDRACFSVSGRLIDRAVEQALLETISPLALEGAMQAIERLSTEKSDLIRQYELKLQQARYEAERMHRQYDAVEPENRLVVAQLETRWNQALEHVEKTEKELAEVTNNQQTITEQDREQILALADDLEKVWRHPSSAGELKTRIARTILKEIIIFRKQEQNLFYENINVVVHWQGGDHTKLALRRQRRAKNGALTNEEVIHIVSKLARIMDDRDIAMFLNRSGKRTARGNTWSQDRIIRLRRENNIAPYLPGEREQRGEMTVAEAAKALGTYRNKIKSLIDKKILPAEQACFRAPWIIKAEDIQKLRSNVPIQDAAKEIQLTIAFSATEQR